MKQKYTLVLFLSCLLMVNLSLAYHPGTENIQAQQNSNTLQSPGNVTWYIIIGVILVVIALVYWKLQESKS